jgi:uncharacterized membrane protein
MAAEGRPNDGTEALVDVVVGWVLLAGVLTSLALLTAGIVWHRIAVGPTPFDYTLPGTNVVQFVVSDVRQLLSGELRPRLLVNVGLAVLMLTPFARVVASFLYFAFVARDRKYAVFTAFVLAVLTLSLFGRG